MCNNTFLILFLGNCSCLGTRRKLGLSWNRQISMSCPTTKLVVSDYFFCNILTIFLVPVVGTFYSSWIKSWKLFRELSGRLGSTCLTSSVGLVFKFFERYLFKTNKRVLFKDFKLGFHVSWNVQKKGDGIFQFSLENCLGEEGRRMREVVVRRWQTMIFISMVYWSRERDVPLALFMADFCSVLCQDFEEVKII